MSTTAGVGPDVARSAADLADRVASSCGVRVGNPDDPADFRAAADVLQRIWNQPHGVPIPSEMLRAFAFTGNYVGMVHDGADAVAVTCAFRTDHGALHSHIAGVLPAYQGRSIGYLLKLHQRAWALSRGIASISWTFDPLVRRNAHFNLVKLGAVATTFLPDFYGAMADQLNAGDRSDRLLVEWDLAATTPGSYLEVPPGSVRPLLSRGPDGEPVLSGDFDASAAGASAWTISVPGDIDRVKQTDRQLAVRWRMAVRSAMTAAFRNGLLLAGLDRDEAYVARRRDAP
ncbi:MAG TPA: GNAT family N-acetyltransferase [Nakamurella sp.]|nr:GNAT family N-acetyltransferase [Nakamurella sp.]